MNHDIIDRSNEVEEKREQILTLLQLSVMLTKDRCLEVEENAIAVATTRTEQTELVQAFAHQQTVISTDTHRGELRLQQRLVSSHPLRESPTNQITSFQQYECSSSFRHKSTFHTHTAVELQ